jgi:ribonucleotide monophosphatase NagD (HAD superfamily)
LPGDPLYNSVELVFCNPDLLWRSDYEHPRLGQGAFKEALLSTYKVEDQMMHHERTKTILGFNRFELSICSIRKAHDGDV